jgi:hypothetical protein
MQKLFKLFYLTGNPEDDPRKYLMKRRWMACSRQLEQIKRIFSYPTCNKENNNCGISCTTH